MGAKKKGWIVSILMLVLVLCFSVQAGAYTGFKPWKGKIRYYDANGKLVKNQWVKVGKKYYYCQKGGTLAIGLKKIDNSYYYFNKKGAAQTGWKTIKNKKYYFVSKTRAAATGLFKFKNGKTYYFTNKGVMKTGWVKINDAYYYFNSNGTMKTGWLKLNSKTYYLIKSGDQKGQRATGIFSIGGKLYYFDPDTALLQKNTTVEYKDRTYKVDANGVATVQADTLPPSSAMLFFLQFESGSERYNQTGGDGGKACGAYQFDYRYALLPFVKYAYQTNPSVCKEFKDYASLSSGTKLKNNKKFYKAWNTIYNRNKKTFAELQDTYARVNYYDNVERNLQNAGIDIASRSDVVKGAIFSYSIQHGQTEAVTAVKAIKPKSTMSDQTFLEKLYAYRIKKHKTHKTRYQSELALALTTLGVS